MAKTSALIKDMKDFIAERDLPTGLAEYAKSRELASSSLHEKMRKEGVRWQHLIDEARKERLLALLREARKAKADPPNAVDMAASLGYTSTEAFNRAHKRLFDDKAYFDRFSNAVVERLREATRPAKKPKAAKKSAAPKAKAAKPAAKKSAAKAPAKKSSRAAEVVAKLKAKRKPNPAPADDLLS